VPPPTELEEHDELSILDQLGLAEETTSIRLKQVLLDKSDVEDSISQLTKYVLGRLDEGHGEILFDLGLEDNGDTMGFSREEWDFAYARLVEAAEAAKADCSVLMTRNVGGKGDVGPNGKDNSCSGKVMVRRRPGSVDDVIETRIAVVGNVDAGKSTMLGVLVKGGLDDGRGKARVNLFRHKHEVESGRTSSVGMEIMGFDTKGEVVSSNVPGRKLSWEEIGQRSVCILHIFGLHVC
jgi:GTPase